MFIYLNQFLKFDSCRVQISLFHVKNSRCMNRKLCASSVQEFLQLYPKQIWFDFCSSACTSQCGAESSSARQKLKSYFHVREVRWVRFPAARNFFRIIIFFGHGQSRIRFFSGVLAKNVFLQFKEDTEKTTLTGSEYFFLLQ